MASPASQSWQAALKIENDLGLLLKDKAPRFGDVDNLIKQLRLACEATILTDFEYANERDVEKHLWDSHVKINQRYRKIVDRYKQDELKKNVVERRKLEQHYADFIKTSQFFYKGYIQRLASQFNGLSELRRIADRLELDCQTADQRIAVSPEVKHLIDSSCHGTLLRLGDLSRYRNHLRSTQRRSWDVALGYYQLANDFMPEDGSAHNQMAVIALADGNHLDAVYHLYRALAVNEPHILAKGNLEIEFNKIKLLWERKRAPPKNDSLSALVWWFVLLHAKFYDGVEFQTHEELESEVLSQLALLLKEENFEEVFQKVILVNLSAGYFAAQRIQEADGVPSPELIRSYYFFLALNLRMMFTLLQLLQPELEEKSSGEDLPVTDSPTQSSSREKVTVIARRVLPALRQYSVWLVSQADVIVGSVSVGPIVLHAKEMWRMYADVLTRLANFYPVENLSTVNYLLEEDENTVGFKPLRDPLLPVECNLYVDEHDVAKPHIADLGTKRNLPSEEMRARVRDIIVCALILHQNDRYPIRLETRKEEAAFVFVEEGLAISSPIPADPVPYHESPPYANTDFGIPDAVRRTKAEANAESVTSDSHNSMDVFMNRMVDDLLEPTNGREDAYDETSYGMHSGTADELFGHLKSNGYRHQVQSPERRLPSLPSVWNSPFAHPSNDFKPTSPSRPSTRGQLSPVQFCSAQGREEAAEHLEQMTGYGSRSPKRASTQNSQAVTDVLQHSLAEQFNPMSITSSGFSDSSSLYANNTPLNRQPLNATGYPRHFAPVAPLNTENTTFYAGASAFDKDAMLQSSIWQGSQPRRGGYTQTPPGGQGG